MEKKDCKNCRVSAADAADRWLQNELNKLKPSHYDGTFFTIARLRQMNGWHPRTIDICVPVEKWCNGETGFEVISIESLAAQCPWNMMDTRVTVHTSVTHIDGPLMQLIDDSIVNDRIAELSKERKGREVGVYESITDADYPFRSSWDKAERLVSPGHLVME